MKLLTTVQHIYYVTVNIGGGPPFVGEITVEC